MTTQTGTACWVGTAMQRKEDWRLLHGEGRFLDDVALPGLLHLAVLRSPHAHARLAAIDLSGALALSGVAAAAAGPAVAPDVAPIDILFKSAGLAGIPPLLPLAVEQARYVGEGVAAVVARSRYEAEDALEAISVQYEPLPAVVDVVQAAAPGAPLVHAEIPGNLAFRGSIKNGDVEGAFAQAEVVLRECFTAHRNAGIPLERRGVIAQYDRATRQFTVWATTQAPHLLRMLLARSLQVPEHDIRVIAPDVGGGFGVYYNLFPEDVLACWFARRLGRPVKFVEDRRETLIGTLHAGDMTVEAEIAALKDGTVLAVRNRVTGDLGAYLECSGVGPQMLCAATMPGCYRFPAYQADVACYYTHKTRFGAFRGFGMAEGNLVMEGLIDRLARHLGLDPVTVRRRNFIQPDQFPFRTAAGSVYDSGDYPRCLDEALRLLDYDSLRAEQARLRVDGHYVGVGLACFVEATCSGPPAHLARLGNMVPGYEPATVRIENTGHVTVISGLCPTGQGMETALAQVAADELCVDPAAVRLVCGDTALAPRGTRGTANSRGAVLGGNAVAKAAKQVRQKALALAAHLLGEPLLDLELRDGQIWVAGQREPAMDLARLGYEAYIGHRLPPGMPPGLEAHVTFEPEALTFSNGVHACVVEIDPTTCRLHIRRYVVVDDCGNVINPMLVDGQLIGGTAQGIGRALLEEVHYDPQGQPLTATLMDYLLPTAPDVPRFELGHVVTPSPLNPLGLKGVGEGGTIGPYAALANAVSDALAPLGVSCNELPISTERLFHLLAGAAK